MHSTFLCIALFTITVAYAQEPFVTTWKTNPGVSNSTSIEIPTLGGGYNYQVDWNNDGIYDQLGITGNVTHDFGVAGTYTIRIKGAFPRIWFDYLDEDSDKLLTVSQWGDIAWASMDHAFFYCSNLQITATDLPNLSQVESMASMFYGCATLNGPTNIGNWNTAHVTDMNGMFNGAKAFNQPIGNWNTANVTDMHGMFANTKAFNQPIGNWNTANVTDMNNMFEYASAFNQPIGNWKTTKVTNLSSMFYEATAFNCPIGSWNTANVKYMFLMFFNASAFNQPIGSWKTSNVEYMYNMFSGASAFNQPIGNWNTTKVINMNNMFSGASAFNQPIGNWNTAKVTSMSGMFRGAVAFNQPIGLWNTANVKSMYSMFSNAKAFNQSISNWKTASVTNMESMFKDASKFNQSLGSWLLNPGVNLSEMLDGSGLDCKQYSATLIGWGNNPGTPNHRSLGAASLQFGTNAVIPRAKLALTKSWTFNGDVASGVNCSGPVISASLGVGSPENDVLLAWQANSETNNLGFEIERSADGKTFEKIGFVEGNGDGREAYRFVDASPLTTTYYRLKLVGQAAGTLERDPLDGDFEYSNVISVSKPAEKVVIYPNPTSNSFYLKGLDKEQKMIIKDTNGKEVLTQLWSPGMAVKVDHLPAGQYFIWVAGQKMRVMVKKENP